VTWSASWASWKASTRRETTVLPVLTDLAGSIERITGHPPDVIAPSAAEVRRLGLALEPPARVESLDALFLHRHWGMRDVGIGVLASHFPFDERLTVGFNPELAEVLGIEAPEVLGTKEGRPLGMIGGFAGGDLLVRVIAAFGEPEAVERGSGAEIRRVAAVGAMTDALVREAAARGAGAYVTGQMRAPARRAVAETGIAVIAIGHRRSEVWGLHLLARLLRDEWPGLETVVLDAP
jgi:putative NIF3 family GTP cyclohydrolase 1 type 2